MDNEQLVQEVLTPPRGLADLLSGADTLTPTRLDRSSSREVSWPGRSCHTCIDANSNTISNTRLKPDLILAAPLTLLQLGHLCQQLCLPGL